MAMTLPLSTNQMKDLESILARCDMTREQEERLAPVLRRLRENLVYQQVRPNTVLDDYYEK